MKYTFFLLTLALGLHSTAIMGKSPQMTYVERDAIPKPAIEIFNTESKCDVMVFDLSGILIAGDPMAGITMNAVNDTETTLSKASPTVNYTFGGTIKIVVNYE